MRIPNQAKQSQGVPAAGAVLELLESKALLAKIQGRAHLSTGAMLSLPGEGPAENQSHQKKASHVKGLSSRVEFLHATNQFFLCHN